MLHKVKNHPDYVISMGGAVINTKTKRELKHSMSNTGYLTVYVDGRNELLHRLLAETFIDNPHNLPCINHIDGNKLNNSLDNLEWCTYSYNNSHAYKAGLKKHCAGKGDKSSHHKLSSNDVKYIKANYKRYNTVYGAKALAKKYNVSPSCITAIVYGVNWR